MAMDSQADELFFGGAAGGGKSDLLLGLALTQHKRSLILRRVATYLKGMTDRLKQIGAGKTLWRGSGWGGTMMDPVRKSLVELSGCESEDDKFNYQGVPHDLVGFDEASHFSKSQFQFISAWNRTVDKQQRCRVVLVGNPPMSPEGRWIVEEWAPWLDQHYPNPARPGELRWFTTIEGKTQWVDGSAEITHKGQKLKPRSRTFIPSRLSDNPILSATDYGAKLQALPEPLRSQLLFGDMNAGVEDDEWQLIPTEWVRMAQQRWREGPPEGVPLSCIGVDIARGGRDKTVISKRYGTWFARLAKFPGASTPDGPTTAMRITADYDGEAQINIDNTGGWGTSPLDLLKDKHHKKVNGIIFSSATDFTDKSKKLQMVNLRAAMYWKLREDLDPNSGQGLALPPDPELLSDLCSVRYKPMTSGIKVELKEEIIKRLGRSPDCADAVVLANWFAKKKEFWIA